MAEQTAIVSVFVGRSEVARVVMQPHDERPGELETRCEVCDLGHIHDLTNILEGAASAIRYSQWEQIVTTPTPPNYAHPADFAFPPDVDFYDWYQRVTGGIGQ